MVRAVSVGNERFPLSDLLESQAVDGKRKFARLTLGKFHFYEQPQALLLPWNRQTLPMVQLSSFRRLNNLHSSSNEEHLQHLLAPLIQSAHQHVLDPFRARDQLHHQGPSRQAHQLRARLRVRSAKQLDGFHPFPQAHLPGAHLLTHALLQHVALVVNLAARLLSRQDVKYSASEVN